MSANSSGAQEMGERDVWFVQELREYSSTRSSAREDAKLLQVCERFRHGTSPEGEYFKYKAAAIHFIGHCLPSAQIEDQQALIQFLLQSELINESMEVRTALYQFLRAHLTFPLDRISLNIATALIHSGKTPATNIVKEIFERVLAEHRASPSWSHIAILAASLGRTGSIRYTTADLIQDISLLANTKDFEKHLKRRNAIWTGLPVPTDSIDILLSIRRSENKSRPNYPSTPDFTTQLEKLNQSIVQRRPRSG